MSRRLQRMLRRCSLGALIPAGALYYGLTSPQTADRAQVSPKIGDGADVALGSATRRIGDPPPDSSGLAVQFPNEALPWEIRHEQTVLPPGTVPVSAVAPPPPDPAAPLPPAPVEPRNPAQHRPPTHNPGGIDADRPSRPVPGLL